VVRNVGMVHRKVTYSNHFDIMPLYVLRDIELYSCIFEDEDYPMCFFLFTASDTVVGKSYSLTDD